MRATFALLTGVLLGLTTGCPEPPAVTDDGVLVHEESDIETAATWEIRLDQAPGAECKLVLYDGTGSIPGGEAFACDLLADSWPAQPGYGPLEVGAITVGSCVPGCMDVLADNFDAKATSEDGSCEYHEGCTDERALNYDPLAVVDDGTCDFVGFGDITLTIDPDFYYQETTVGLECNGYALYYEDSYTSSAVQSHDFIIDAGYDCILWISDSYGDAGPPGELWYCGDLVEAWSAPNPAGANPWTLSIAEFFTTGCSGCTNPVAGNYDPTARLDDGSCDQ